MDSKVKLANDMNNMAKALEGFTNKVMNDLKKQMNKDPKSAEMFSDALKEVDLSGKQSELSRVQKDAENFLKKYNAGKSK